MRCRVLLEVKKGMSVQGVNHGCSKALSSIISVSPQPSLCLSWPQPQHVPAVGMQCPLKKCSSRKRKWKDFLGDPEEKLL